MEEHTDHLESLSLYSDEEEHLLSDFIPSRIDRIKEVKDLIQNTDIKIEVDGGINDTTIKEVSEVNIAVVGSYITTSDNPIDRINSLLV